MKTVSCVPWLVLFLSLLTPMTAGLNILQWNMRGFRSNITDLQALVASKSPVAVALQETKLKPEHNCNLHHYKTYRHDLTNTQIAHGGVALLVHYSVPSVSFPLRTGLQAVAATVDLTHIKLT